MGVKEGATTQLMFKIVRLLLERGANPNAEDGRGLTALNHAVTHRSEELIVLLLKFGAEPGMSALVLNPDILFRKLQFPHAVKAYEDRILQSCQQRRQEAKDAGSLKSCCVCHASRHCKRCAACFLVWYCGEACQVSDWVNHKTACQEAVAQYRPAVVCFLKASDKLSFAETCLAYTGILLDGPDPSKSHFVVKVQKLAEAISRLAINNKEMTVSGLLVSTAENELYRILKDKIEAEGVFGNMAFFQATWDTVNGLKINPYVVLPPKMW
jgi:hypothetical protein